MAVILNAVSTTDRLAVLKLDHNLAKSRSRIQTIQAFNCLCSVNNPTLTTLSLAKCLLKADAIPMLIALGKNTTITDINLEGNHMGDAGARILATMLHYNTVCGPCCVLALYCSMRLL